MQLIGGQHAGKCAFIPRITLSPPVEAVGFHLSRRQFVLRLAFAMTISVATGQVKTRLTWVDLRPDPIQ